MRIILFGGVGFIGTNIARLALQKGHQVIACDNLMRPGVESNLDYLRKFKNFVFQYCDIRKRRDVFRVPKAIDCIINLAANPSVPKSIKDPIFDFQNNVVGHLNILEFARSNGRIPVIFASSNKVYTDKINSLSFIEKRSRYLLKSKMYHLGFDEHIDVDGSDGYTNSPYGVSKLTAEKYSREYNVHYGVPIIINRMSCIYGEFQKGVEEQGWIDWFLRAKRKELPITIYGDGKQVRDALFGRDVAELYLFEAEHIGLCTGKTFNVGGGPQKGFNTSLLELITRINKMFRGKSLQYTFKPWRESDQRYYISNITHVTQTTGWKPMTSISDGLALMWRANRRES